MAKKIYKVISPVDHDRKRYEIGDSIELGDEHAKPLLAVNTIELDAAATSSAPAAPKDDAERIAAIASAIGKLDKTDDSLWTGAGAPKTEAIGAVTGWPVSGKDRDAAWAQFSAG